MIRRIKNIGVICKICWYVVIKGKYPLVMTMPRSITPIRQKQISNYAQYVINKYG